MKVLTKSKIMGHNLTRYAMTEECYVNSKSSIYSKAKLCLLNTGKAISDIRLLSWWRSGRISLIRKKIQ